MRVPGHTGMHAWPYGGARRPTSSGASAARECTPWPMVARFGSGNPRAMRLLPTLRRSRADDPVLAWAFRYALAAMVAGAGILLHGPSPAVGWALIVFGGSLATLMSGPPTRREGEADPGTARSASRASRRGDRRIEHAHGHRRASAASRLSRAVRARSRDSGKPLGVVAGFGVRQATSRSTGSGRAGARRQRGSTAASPKHYSWSSSPTAIRRITPHVASSWGAAGFVHRANRS
jgi:hypothetical protein